MYFERYLPATSRTDTRLYVGQFESLELKPDTAMSVCRRLILHKSRRLSSISKCAYNARSVRGYSFSGSRRPPWVFDEASRRGPWALGRTPSTLTECRGGFKASYSILKCDIFVPGIYYICYSKMVTWLRNIGTNIFLNHSGKKI